MLVHQFLKWMETAPSSRRADATSALARAWLYSSLDIEERNAAEAALTLVLDDPSPIVRRSLAEALCRHPEAPRHIILALIQDQTDIASIVLAASPVLMDAELVDLAATGGLAIQCAIAVRPVVSCAVGAALAEIGCEDACDMLLKNDGAEWTRSGLWRVAERFCDSSEIRDTLLGKKDLPLDLRQALIARLSASLGDFAVLRAWMPPERAEIVAREACDRATIAMASEADGEAVEDLINHLRSTGQLTTVLLLRALCSGHVVFFETAVTLLSGLPQERVQSLITSKRHNGFRAIYDRAGLPTSAFAAFKAALDLFIDLVERDPSVEITRLSATMLETVLNAHHDSGTIDNFDQVTVMLRRLATEAAREDARAYVRDTGIAA